MHHSEIEALLEQAALQFILGDLAETELSLALLGDATVSTEASKLAGELRQIVKNNSAEDEWPDEAGLARMEAGLDQLRNLLSVGGSQIPPPTSTGATSENSNSLSALTQDPELIGDFILEAREHLRTVESGLLVLEKEPANPDTLNAVFRSFHTIKGLAGFLELANMQALAHEVETILDLARTGQLVMTPNLIDLTLEISDYVGKEVNGIEAQLQTGDPGPLLDPGLLLIRVRTVIAGDVPAEVVATNRSQSPANLAHSAGAPVGQLHAKTRRVVATGPPAIRVDTAKLDYLLDMVGEMVIAESMVRLDPEWSGTKNPRLLRNLNQLRRVTEEVQKVAMATRLISVDTLFQRVNRLVRDTASKAGKLAEVELIGEDTQLDKTIVEELTDPIMHMVRNSIDHGIEIPAERIRAGKPQSGLVQLKAYRQADYIQIEIRDDGRGLHKEKILAKARERGLLSEAAPMTDSEIFQLIFEPGFSTAAQVTAISGRGVGMDVVRKQIQKLRGKIDIHSTPGLGTTFYIKLPLTLAIIEGLVVGVGKERYILPIFSVQEMFRPVEGQVSTVQSRGEMVMVRNQLFPLIRLHRSLGVKPKTEDSAQALLIVAETEGKRFVLMVDEFVGKQEVVIKSLGASLKNTTGIAGGAILGDGRVGLILDLEAIWSGRNSSAEVIKESFPGAC